MTGFGEASGAFGNASLAIEVQAVNHRHLKLRIRLPEPLALFEPAAEQLLRRRVPRGSLSLNVQLRGDSSQRLHLDRKLLSSYVEELRAVQAELGLQGAIGFETLAALPGALRFAAPDYSPQQADFLSMLERALEALEQARRSEGEALGVALRTQLDAIEQQLALLAELLPAAVRAYQQRLQQRVADLLEGGAASFEGGGLQREVALIAEKSSLQEEVDRLRSHVERMRAQLDCKEPVGRSLEFLAQEMLREANTMAAKSIDADIVHRVLAIKLQVDHIREQVSNVQ